MRNIKKSLEFFTKETRIAFQIVELNANPKMEAKPPEYMFLYRARLFKFRRSVRSVNLIHRKRLDASNNVFTSSYGRIPPLLRFITAVQLKQ